MDFLQQLLESTNAPIISAFLLGLMMAISPCPLATNITAIAYVGKDIEDRRRVFINGLIYTLGRAISYVGIALLLYFGASKFEVSKLFQHYGEKLLGPLLLIIGILMLGVINIKLPGSGKWADKFRTGTKKSWWDVLLMGIVFALAFCPYSGVLYFGMLIPMTLSSSAGLLLPFVFAIATGLPVIVFAYLIAFTFSEVGGAFNKIKTFEKWFRKFIAILFIAVGFYYIIIFFLK